MKKIPPFFITLLFTVGIPLISFAQDNTKVGLPEGAIARLGKGGINVMRFSHDGARLAVGTNVGVWLYDVNTGNAKALFPAQPRRADNKAFKPSAPEEWRAGTVSYVKNLVFSPDDRILAVGESRNYVVQLWDVESGSELSMLPLTGRHDQASAIAFSEDSKTLITPNYFGDIIHWDTVSGSQRIHLDSYRPDLTLLEEDGKRGSHSFDELAFAQDGMTFVSRDPKDGKIRLWDAVTGRQLAIFKAKTPFAKLSEEEPEIQKGVNALVFSPDGKTVASAHDDNTLRLWDVASRTETVTLKGHKERINTLAFSPDSTIVVSGSADETIMLWDVSNKQRQTTITGHNGSVKELTFSPDGKIFASGSSDGTIRFWNMDTRREMSIFAIGHTAGIKRVAFTANDRMLATAAANGTVQIWNLQTGQQLLPPPLVSRYDETVAMAFSQDATLFASHGADTTIRSRGTGTRINLRPHTETRLWILPTGDEITALPQEASSLAFSSDKRMLAVGRNQGIRLLDTNSWGELLYFNIKNRFESKLLFSPNGKLLVTYGTYTPTQIWDVTTEREITPPNIKKSAALAFSPDNTLLANGNNDGIVLWNILPTGLQERIKIPNSKRGFDEALLFSPDGKILLDATGLTGKDIIRLWDVDTGRDLGTLSGHTWRIQTLNFSHDGKTLASGSDDGTVLLWDWEKIITKATPKNEGD